MRRTSPSHSRLLGMTLLCLAAASPLACGGSDDTLVIVEVARGTAIGDVTRIDLALELGGQIATRTLERGGAAITLPTDALFGIRSGSGPIKVTATASIGDTTITGDTTDTVTRGDTTRITVTLGSHTVNPCTPEPCDDGGSGTPRLEIDRTAQDFGDVLVGQRSLPVQLTVTNRGDAASSTITTTLTAASGTPFAVSADTCAGQALAAGARCTLSVEFAPTVAGDLTGTLKLAALTGGQVEVVLAGRAATAGDLAADPEQLPMGAVAVGGVSATQQIVILNRGGSATGTLMVDVTGTDAAEFPLPSDTCNGQPLSGGTSCQIMVRFQPTMAGSRQASLRVRANPGGTALVSLSGTGLTTGSLRIDHATRDLGMVLQGQASATSTLHISNVGQSPSGVPSVTLSGLNASDFAIVSHTCNAALEPGGACDVIVRMTPSEVGSRAAQLEVSASPGGAVTSALSGLGLAPASFTWSPSGQDFGGVTLGSFANATLALRNAGGVTSEIPFIGGGGIHQGDFTIVTNGCIAALTPGATCQVLVRFTPAAAGARQAALSAVAPNGNGGSASAPLSGIGQTPGAIDIDPALYDFGSILQGTAAPTRIFTVTNTGQSATSALSVRFTGSAASDFSLSTDTCTGVTLSANAFCTVTVQFLPVAAGSKTAGLEVAASTGGIATSALSGRGLAPARFRLLPTMHTFPDTLRDQVSPTQDFTLSNLGEVATSVPTVSMGGAHPPDFERTSNGCTAALGPGQSCVIRVRFRPLAGSGQRSASLNVSAMTGGSVAAALAGLVLAPANLTLSASSGTDFGPVLLNATSDLAFGVTNTGDVAAAAITVSLGGAFSRISSPNDCTSTLAGGGACIIRVRFQPSTRGAQMTSLQISGTPGGTPAALTLTGVGQRPVTLEASPATVSFGSAELTVPSATVRVTITNSGDLTSEPIQVESSQPTEFTFSPCGGALTPGASCDVYLGVQPLAVGSRSGLYTVRSGNQSAGAVSIMASATGVTRLTWSYGGTGTITATPPGTSCGSGCALYPGGSVTLQARTTNGSNHVFAGFTGSPSCLGPARDCTVNMNTSHHLDGVFYYLGFNLAFVSSASTPANLGGTAPYDAHCNAAASAAGINNAAGNAFIAWISDANSSALSRLGSARGLIRMDGRPVTSDLRLTMDINDQRYWNAIVYDELGGPAAWDSFARTGMNEDGSARDHCNNWTGTGTGTGGMPTSRQWMSGGGIGCTQPYPVYCMMKTFSNNVSPSPQDGKVVFVSTPVLPGGGVAAFDARCNAEKPSGSGTFKAMITTTTTPASSVLNLAQTYITPSRQILGTGADLANNNRLQTGHWQLGNGSFATTPSFILTGGGLPTMVGTVSSTCNDWTSLDPSTGYRTGRITTLERSTWWQSGFGWGCDQVDRYGVLCVEQ